MRVVNFVQSMNRDIFGSTGGAELARVAGRCYNALRGEPLKPRPRDREQFFVAFCSSRGGGGGCAQGCGGWSGWGAGAPRQPLRPAPAV